MISKIKVPMADHQKAALAKMHDGCILWGGVGSGKSRAGMAYYVTTEEHEDLYVITTAKKRDSLDWEEEAIKFGVSREASLSFAGKITVDSWNNIEKYTDVKNAFFIFDEQRLVGAGKWSKSFLKIAKANRWIMLSATPGDTWLDYIPVFVANGFYKNRTQFKHDHVIYAPFSKYPKVERYVDVQRLVKHRNQILVHMPYERGTTRHPVILWTPHNEKELARVSHGRWDVFEDEPVRDIAHMFHVMRRVVNSDPSRAREVAGLMEKHPRLIVFYNFNYELDLLRGLLDGQHSSDIYGLSAPGFRIEPSVYAEWNGQKHEEIPDAERWVYLVQYAAGAEGWNCVTTNATCFYSLPYSYKLWEQAHGRIDRLNTTYTDLYYYILRSKAAIDWSIWRSLKSKKSFQTRYFDLSDNEYAELNYQR